MKQWRLAPRVLEGVQEIKRFHPIISELLRQRGIRTEEEAERFLFPSYERDLHDPFLFLGMERAVRRIFDALARGERVTVHGDYDADGVTGSAVLITTLREVGAAAGSKSIIDFYIPHREEEGYGLHSATVDILRARGTNLIITVDCGIACRDAIAHAHDLQIDTIVVDHHEFPASLPDAILIHPRLPGESYPFPHLAAVGVSWKLACALYGRARETGLAVHPAAEKWLLDLTAIATVTDVMPLVGENRALEHYGLKVLRQTKRLGLRKLCERGRIRLEESDTFTIGFQIGPRLNAAGRMEHAQIALELLLTEDEKTAEERAALLEELNRERQNETARILAEARMQAEKQEKECILCAVGDGWPAGLVGLVAGRLVQEFARPVLVMGKDGERIVGSGRSVPGFHITDALSKAGERLARFGGHPQACGFEVKGTDELDGFLKDIRAAARETLGTREFAPTLEMHAELPLGEISIELADQVGLLAPFGEANPIPVFTSRNLKTVEVRRVGGDGRHLRLILGSSDGAARKFIAFGMGARADEIARMEKIEVAYEMGVNEWNGSREVQCKVIDIRNAL